MRPIHFLFSSFVWFVSVYIFDLGFLYRADVSASTHLRSPVKYAVFV